MNNKGNRDSAARTEHLQTTRQREWRSRDGLVQIGLAKNSQKTRERERRHHDRRVLVDLAAWCAGTDTGRDIEQDRLPQLGADCSSVWNSLKGPTESTGLEFCSYDNQTRPGGREPLLSQGQREETEFFESVSDWTWAPKIVACDWYRLDIRSQNLACLKHQESLPVLDKEHPYHRGDNLEANPDSSLRFCGNCSSFRRRACASVIDCASILAGGVATVAILNFNQMPGKVHLAALLELNQLTLAETCPASGNEHWLPSSAALLGRVEETLRCPGLPLYLAAISTYSAAGLSQLVRGHQYWADCALVAVVASVLTGAVWGGRAMCDALVLGGLLSLVCCRILELFMGGRERQLRETLGGGYGAS